ncbi:MAG: hypothetical protein ACTS7I_00130 [Candidatus Hodgkinia cicadicola]
MFAVLLRKRLPSRSSQFLQTNFIRLDVMLIKLPNGNLFQTRDTS